MSSAPSEANASKRPYDFKKSKRSKKSKGSKKTKPSKKTQPSKETKASEEPTAADRAEALSTRVCQNAFKSIHRACPYLNTDDLNAFLGEKLHEELQQFLQIHEPAMAAAKAKFDFKKLPAELRVRIFELALARPAEEPFEVQRQDVERVSEGQVYEPITVITASKMPGLLHVNRQWRQEALPIFFRDTTFSASMRPHMCWEGHGLTRTLGKWLEMVGKKRAAQITKLEVIYLGIEDEEILVVAAYGVLGIRLKDSETLRKRDIVERDKLEERGLAYEAIRVGYSEADWVEYLED